jgi:beta-glucosidase
VESGVRQSAARGEGALEARIFPEGFLWGCATSSHQVEGHDDSDWSAWEHQPGHIHDGTTSGEACGWWAGRAEEDLALAASMGHRAIRLSLEWSRIEPEPGRDDTRAFDRYAQILARARELGLVAMVGLNHFTLPRWFAERGGWLARDAVERFGAYAQRCARVLGDLVPLWTTLNEPSVLGYMAYAGRQWPPGLGDLRAGFRAIRAQLLAHGAAWHAVHRVRPDARVGLVVNMPQFVPVRPDRRRDRWVAAAQDWVFNGVVVDALAHARFRAPLAIATEPAPSLRGALDFLGLNYYGRYRVRFDVGAARELFGRRLQQDTVHTAHTDWGEIAPEGLTAQLLRLARALPGVPLYVTENGIFDPTDERRPGYLVAHVRAVHDAIARGADVRGYFVWTLVDNFEWAEGWSTPFGLVALDRRTQARTPRKSAHVFSAICRAHGIPASLEL